MPSRYHPIEDGLWSDPKFDGVGDLPDAPGDERGFFAFLATNAYQRPSGIYRATDAELAASYHWPVSRVAKTIASLVRRCLIVRDGAWLFCPGYLKRQAHNPSVLSAARKTVEKCTSNTVLNAFAQHYPLYESWCRHRAETVPTPMYKTDPPVPEQYQSSTRAVKTTTPLPPSATVSSPAGDDGTRWPSPEALVEKYNREATDNCPAVTVLSPKRREKAKRYLRVFPDEAWWTVTFAQYHRSRFLSGKSPPRNGHESFVPDLDWLLSVGKDGSENAVKVHDGRYCDGPG